MELLLPLPALAVAMGVDPYLTLALLAAAGATGWWSPPPGGLPDLATGAVMSVSVVLYLAELVAERRPASYLAWNAVHTPVRPLAAGLLALLVVQGAPAALGIAAVAGAVLLAGAAHMVTRGQAVVRWLGSDRASPTLLSSLLEDSVVVALVTLALDHPPAAAAAAAALGVAAALRARSAASAFLFGMGLVAARVRALTHGSRWRTGAALPPGVRRLLGRGPHGPPAGTRACAVGVLGFPGSARFFRAWLVVHGRSAFLIRGDRASRVDLCRASPPQLHGRGMFLRARLPGPNGEVTWLVFGRDGPSAAGLASTFGLSAAETPLS